MATDNGLYLYGIVESGHPCRLSASPVVGGEPGPPRRVPVGPLAAVVSDVPPDLRARRRDLVAHQAVLEELVAQGTTLPMRFGVVAPDEAALVGHLQGEARRYRELLADLAGRVEVNVKAMPDEEGMLRQVAAKDPTVRRLWRNSDGGMSRRIELGRAVAEAIERRQRDDAQEIMGRLDPHAARSAVGPPVQDCALNAAFLVDRDRLDTFAGTLADLDRGFGDRLQLRQTGPLPPYSFVAPSTEEHSWAS